MLKLTTGEGLTAQASSVTFQNCLPGGEYVVYVRWNLFSEEFKEWCGSSFQDQMDFFIETDDGEQPILSYVIDNLCPPFECFGSPECGTAYVGLLQADVVFDQGDVWMTGWREDWVPVVLPDETVFEIRIELTDAGDSIYDTVLLVDQIRLFPCAEACELVECGESVCGESCGQCGEGATCLDGVCCTPQCDDKTCVDDGCGSACPPPEGEEC